MAARSTSINLRLLLASLLILPLFLGLTGVTLDRAFASYQMDSQRESMRLQQLLLARAADWNGSEWVIDGLDEIRFNLLRSGLYAFLLSPDGELLWSSPSAELIGDIEESSQAATGLVASGAVLQAQLGEGLFGNCQLDAAYFCYSTRVAWGSSGPESLFLVVESQERVDTARAAFRGYLLWLLPAAALLLLIAQFLIFRWGLTPLRAIARTIAKLERGEADCLDGDYPVELQPLTDNLNVLLHSEKRRRERVRNTMDRLTHVLKTPLMLMRNSDAGDQAFRQLVQEQVSRMLGIVEGELAKARLDGRAAHILGKPVTVQPVLQRIADAYARLPRRSSDPERQGPIRINTGGVSADATFYGEERDLQDLFGSILENSLKYCRAQIEVTARQLTDDGEEYLELTIGDDGDGIPKGYEREILQRGARADSANIGQGLGLSIVVEIISAYQGSLHTDRSPLGGALFRVRIPTLLERE